MKAKQEKRRTVNNIRFSIGAKLIAIVSLIVILSLGSITILVSWLFGNDLQISAEENNFEANRRSAVEAEELISKAHSNSRTLMQTVTAAGTETAVAKGAVNFFFAENQQIAAVFFIVPGEAERLLTNERFFISQRVEKALAVSYFQDHVLTLRRSARGDAVLLNATPHFALPMLALFFPWQGGGAGCVLFSSEELNNSFGFGTNKSYMINSSADILAHPDTALARSGANFSNVEFIRSIIDSPEKNRQQLIESDFAFLRPDEGYAKQNSVKRNTRLMFDKASDSFYNFFTFLGVEINKPKKRESARQFVAFTKLNTAGALVLTGIEYDKVFEGIAANTRRNIYLAVSVLSISIIFIWFFSKSISVPLKSLALAARNIEDGSFEVKLEPKSRDEIGMLTLSFQKMSKALGVFGKFTNRDIAVKAMRGQIKPGGSPKHATVFFSNIQEFAAKSESFAKIFGDEAPASVVQWLNNYFARMVDCVEKTRGVVDKFVGAAVMAHWGVVSSAGTPRRDAFNCIKAALMMREALYLFNKNRAPGEYANPPIRIGCGINTGIVTAGQMGSNVRMEYTVIGEPVNLASRVESLAMPLGVDILITENTWRLVSDKLITEEMPSIRVKGKEKPVRIFAVINFAGNGRGPRTLSHVRKLLGIKPPDISKVDVNADEIQVY